MVTLFSSCGSLKMPKLRIIHKTDYRFNPDFCDVYEQMEATTFWNWTVRGEWVGRESYIIERREKVTWFGADKWVRAGTDHWYKRDSFGTFEEAKEALKYYDGTVEQFTVVWESP